MMIAAGVAADDAPESTPSSSNSLRNSNAPYCSEAPSREAVSPADQREEVGEGSHRAVARWTKRSATCEGWMLRRRTRRRRSCVARDGAVAAVDAHLKVEATEGTGSETAVEGGEGAARAVDRKTGEGVRTRTGTALEAAEEEAAGAERGVGAVDGTEKNENDDGCTRETTGEVKATTGSSDGNGRSKSTKAGRRKSKSGAVAVVEETTWKTKTLSEEVRKEGILRSLGPGCELTTAVRRGRVSAVSAMPWRRWDDDGGVHCGFGEEEVDCDAPGSRVRRCAAPPFDGPLQPCWPVLPGL